MPIYEYQCESCGGVFEVRQKFSDEPLKVHESCGGAVHRLLSAPALQFKGTGWYITDYAKGNGGPSSRPSTHSHTGTDSKPSSGSSDSGSGSTSSSSSSSEKK